MSFQVDNRNGGGNRLYNALAKAEFDGVRGS